MTFAFAPSLSVYSSFSRGSLHLTHQQRCPVQPSVRRRGCVIECRRGGRDSGTSKAKERRRGDGRRPSRVGEMIFREITPIVEDAFANAFEGEASAPVVVTVEGVSLTPDLRTARVRVTVLGSVDQKKQVLKWLKQTSKSLRFELAQCIHMKYVPELSFGESDEPSAVRTVDLLERLERERQEKEASGSQKIVFEEGKDTFDMEDAIFAGDEDDDESTIGPSYMLQPSLAENDLEGGDDGDEDDEDLDDDNIVNVDENDEDLEEMSDENFRKLVYGRIDPKEGRN